MQTSEEYTIQFGEDDFSNSFPLAEQVEDISSETFDLWGKESLIRQVNLHVKRSKTFILCSKT